MTRDLEKIKKIAKLITKQIGGSPVEDQEMLPEYGIQGSGIIIQNYMSKSVGVKKFGLSILLEIFLIEF
mgnify:CR=1 FL=1